MSSIPTPEKPVKLKHKRPYFTGEGCRVETTWWSSMKGESVEDVTLSCAAKAREIVRREHA